MPITPYAVDVTVNDASGALQGATVFLRNLTKKSQTSEVTSDENGYAEFDLANLPLGNGQTLEYAVGDTIVAIAHNKATRSYDAYLWVVASGDNGEKAITLTLNNECQYVDNNCRILDIVTANTAASVAYLKLYSITDGELLCWIETPANDTQNVHFGDRGKGCNGGFVAIREATTLMYTVTVK